MKNFANRTLSSKMFGVFTQKLYESRLSTVYKFCSKSFMNSTFKFDSELQLGNKLIYQKNLLSNRNIKNFSEKSNDNIENTENKNENKENVEAKISINYGNIKGTKSGDTGHYIIMFTCKKCDNRTTRMFTKHSYHHGVVLIRCECCEGVHLIADNLGWFDDGVSNIEQFLKIKGEEIKRLSVDGLFSFAQNESDSTSNKV